MGTFNKSLKEVKNALFAAGYTITSESRNGNDCGVVLKLANGCVVNCWDKGTVSLQGKCTTEVEAALNSQAKTAATAVNNKKVFVVYGHDTNARTQLEAMLRRWDLDPVILDQLASSGQTIIEKLEEYTSQANFGIVLATPDDIGYPKADETKKKFRVRQNVVLELGMLLSLIGRDKVAILLSQAEDMEKPSDIDGLIYIPFKENVEEAKVSLAKEMERNGYAVSVSKL